MQDGIAQIRDFNRFYTARLGLLAKRYLGNDFSLTESRVLWEIGKTPGVTAGCLCDTLRLNAGYMSRLLASLVKRKLVRQSVSRSDNRARDLSLTASGRKAAAKLDEQSTAQVQDLLTALGERERAVVVDCLARVRSLLSVRVVRLTEITAEAVEILKEYYEAVGVQVRDTPEGVETMVRDPDGGVWIAYLNGEAAGCACLRALASRRFATECKRLYVRPAARGHRVAHSMLDAQEEYARARGLKRIFLDSKDDLKVAIGIYERRGFAKCKRYNDNPQATVFMVKDI